MADNIQPEGQEVTPEVVPAAPVAVLSIGQVDSSIQAILQAIKAFDKAVTFAEIKALDVPYFKTAFGFLKRNGYLRQSRGRSTWGNFYTNPDKQVKVTKALATAPAVATSIKAILQAVKDAPKAMSFGEILALGLPYSKTAYGFLERNGYFRKSQGRRTWGNVYTNPAKAAKVEALLSTQL